MASKARLRWKTDEGSGLVQVDVIPRLQDTRSSTVTEFPLETGAIITDHVIHHPALLTLEIAQTQTPFEDTDSEGEDIEFVKTSVPLDLPRTRFRPQGLLFLLLAAEGALGSVAGALGIGGSKEGFAIEVFRPPYEGRDRINELFDKLDQARLSGATMTLDWLGRTWSGYHIEQITYTRSKGRQLGEFTVGLKQVHTVSTATAALATPAELRLKAGVDGGHRPGKAPTAAEKEAADSSARKSLLKQLIDEIRGL